MNEHLKQLSGHRLILNNKYIRQSVRPPFLGQLFSGRTPVKTKPASRHVLAVLCISIVFLHMRIFIVVMMIAVHKTISIPSRMIAGSLPNAKVSATGLEFADK